MSAEQRDVRIVSETRDRLISTRLFRGLRGGIALTLVTLLSGSAIQCAASGGDGSEASGGRNSGGKNAGGTNSGGNAGSSAGGSSAGGTTNLDGAVIDTGSPKDHTAEEFFIDDPPPTSCDGGGQPIVPGGTPACPDDKHLAGCPCTTEGEKVACWPGLRKHRNRGGCKDGTTTCKRTGENQLTWGACEQYTGLGNDLMPIGTTGKAACTCFSGGYWQIDNTSPCVYCNIPNGTFSCVAGTVQGSASTIQKGPAGTPSDCHPTNTLPPTPWSTNTVTADCNGQFKLCYTLKAGNFDSPMPTDCVMQQVCTSARYDGAGKGDGGTNLTQDFPSLPAWITDASELSCVDKFFQTGGYAEMSVEGESDECDKVNKVFQRVRYCPIKCNNPNDKSPECANCGNGQGGPF